MGVALYPGSFDPIHNGHIAVIETVSEIFETVVVAVADNSRKVGTVPTADRISLIEQSTQHLTNVNVTMFSGLTIDAARDLGASCLVKGVRNSSDFNDEMTQAAMNAASGSIRTLFVPGFGAHGLVSSRFIREIASKGGDVSSSVPPPVVEYLNSSNPSRQV